MTRHTDLHDNSYVDPHTVPCDVCGTRTQAIATKRCDGCWEVEAHLRFYLMRGGEKARNFVLDALAYQGEVDK